MTYALRPYQQEAVEAGIRHLLHGRGNAIEILPTGSGKSLVIAGIARGLGAPCLVFQPSKEILEQNAAKMRAYGYRVGIYSASAGRKDIAEITFATIGSVARKVDLFREFPFILVDECHQVNSKGGMYEAFLSEVGARVLGLTATPYRLTTDGFGGSILKFLTRTRPRVFSEVVYYIQNRQLFDEGFLAPLKYAHIEGFDVTQLKLNSTGADFDDKSVRNYYNRINFPEICVAKVRKALELRRNALVFTRYTEEAHYIVSKVPGCAIVTAETSKRDREQLISDFRAGRTRAVCNVGVLTVGFDYPELETVILARPTMSLALYYQMVGRCIRPHPDKPYSLVVDLCGNRGRFGRVEDLRVEEGIHGKWFISSNGKPLTNVYFGEPYQGPRKAGAA